MVRTAKSAPYLGNVGWYVKNASFRLDLSIMLATVPMVIAGESIDRSAIREAWQDLVREGICESSSLPAEYVASDTRAEPQMAMRA